MHRELFKLILRSAYLYALVLTAMITSIDTPSMPVVFAIVALAIVIDRKE